MFVNPATRTPCGDNVREEHLLEVTPVLRWLWWASCGCRPERETDNTCGSGKCMSHGHVHVAWRSILMLPLQASVAGPLLHLDPAQVVS